MTDETSSRHDLAEHQAVYGNFVRGTIVFGLACAFVLVSLCSFAFGATLPTLVGWAGLIIGFVAILIDLRMGSKTWLLSIGVLLVFGILTGINVSS